MIRSTEIRTSGAWVGTVVGRVTLAYDDRHRRRITMRTDNGVDFLLDLAEAVALRHGDALVLTDGQLVEVIAKPEPLLEVRARDSHHLLRLAWHIGNRHLPAAIEPSRILIRPDHVISAMLVGLGATVAEIDAPFDPEGGAYAVAHDKHDGGSSHRTGAHAHHSHG